MATLCEMMVFSVNSKSWNSVGFKTALGPVIAVRFHIAGILGVCGRGWGVAIRTCREQFQARQNSGQETSPRHPFLFNNEGSKH